MMSRNRRKRKMKGGMRRTRKLGRKMMTGGMNGEPSWPHDPPCL
jgi:hypothetical protein